MMDWNLGFVFLRPLWLLGIPATMLFMFFLKPRKDGARTFENVISEHLREHLLVGEHRRSRFTPGAVLTVSWMLGMLAMAGPSFRAQPNPFADDQAGLMVVVRVSESMMAADLLPSRLERARLKIHELLERRKGAPTGLIAYNGTAHLVMPMTTDGAIIDQMLQALSPDIMPREGDAVKEAIDLAHNTLNRGASVGTVLLVTDSVSADPSGIVHLNQGVQVWAALPGPAELEASGIPGFASQCDLPVRMFATDDRDIDSVMRLTKKQLTNIEQSDASKMEDGGYWGVPILIICALFWSRRGWSVRT